MTTQNASLPTAIALDAVSIALGQRTILEQVSLSINAGEFVGVLGPNGAGKTTLMRALLGLVPLAAGRIALFGEPAAGARRLVGYMPQIRAMTQAQRVSGRDFVACVLDGERWGLPRLDAAGRRAVDAALDAVGATELGRRAVGEMSGGERQRLLLAQCLVGQPRILLLDEPLISLDPHRQQSVVDLVAEVSHRLGITTLFSAHELNPLLGAIDRVLYLGNGAAALGTVEDVITGPILSRLYGAPIDVIRVDGRIFVMSGGQMMEKDAHHHHV
ncbi:ABC transporter ATP-binding protein [Robbsia sp. Bb-Pol-6]|uniref:ABC transporter ATP-binding protein n=1 Tax=Robbsia betulipollinis TaxID=2981849 RepID=A0ABT3ZLV2_9BURK|nr:ABC transporter ATP-binding protein [Robbsia betulipollinis]MCY0387523.1 ABC transporter ATP-binding protein [Robbsia betulipollinis]